jgi:hypothetical protein
MRRPQGPYGWGRRQRRTLRRVVSVVGASAVATPSSRRAQVPEICESGGWRCIHDSVVSIQIDIELGRPAIAELLVQGDRPGHEAAGMECEHGRPVFACNVLASGE